MIDTELVRFLKHYTGPPVRFMEVCGTHTAQIAKCGITSLLSPEIRLISGPGCPVCVTVTGYIDRLIELSKAPRTVVATFGDMMRVPGSSISLREAKAGGGRVEMVYSPLDILSMAKAHRNTTYVFAAVGFETTVPVYAMLLERAIEEKVDNIRLLTSLKTMPPVMEWVCRNQRGIDGFLAPGHVSVVTGSGCFNRLTETYGIPFAVSGFEGEEILAAVYALVKRRGRAGVMNLYPSAVTERGNEMAQAAISRYFEPCGAAWRGMGIIAGSGLALREEFAAFDAGSRELCEDRKFNRDCRCASILTGEAEPEQCPLFGRGCTPEKPQGACMVSMEGSCYHHLTGRYGG